ncbi:MAG TPA: hypothetical protein PK030_01660, partial [Bacilli bacterium]|nr:hypothetical protein [Bacilli bacterium]
LAHRQSCYGDDDGRQVKPQISDEDCQEIGSPFLFLLLQILEYYNKYRGIAWTFLMMSGD